MLKQTFSILVFVTLTISSLANPGLDITSFGARANSGADATEAVGKAMAYIRKHGSHRLFFPLGRYDFYPQQASEKYMFTSNNDEGLKRIVFWISSMSNLEIDGLGSTFIFHGFVSPFVLEHAENIVIKNFSIDWARTFSSEGRILSVDDQGMLLSFSRQYPYKIQEGHLVFHDSSNTEYPYGSLLEFDSAKHETAYMARDYYLTGNQPAEEISPGQVRLLTPDLTGTPGNIMVFNAASRMCPGIVVADCSNLKFDSLTIYHCGGMGIIAQRSRTIQIDHMRVSTAPGSDRMLSITADATHFVNCTGQVSILNSVFENQMDDAVNIHGMYVQITRKLTAKKIEVQLKHAQQLGFDFIRPGDQLELVHNTTMEAFDTFVVHNVTRVNKEFTQVEFTDSLPAELVVGKDVAASIHTYPDVLIRNCLIQKNRARGMLIGSRGRVIVEDNRFHTSGAAILFEGDGSFWFEQAGVRDVRVQHNLFDNCNYGVWGNAAIQIGSGVEPEYRDVSRYNQHIRITNNTFNVFDPRLVHAYSVRGLRFSGNRIIKTTEYPVSHPHDKPFDISFCSDVQIDDHPSSK